LLRNDPFCMMEMEREISGVSSSPAAPPTLEEEGGADPVAIVSEGKGEKKENEEKKEEKGEGEN